MTVDTAAHDSDVVCVEIWPPGAKGSRSIVVEFEATKGDPPPGLEQIEAAVRSWAGSSPASDAIRASIKSLDMVTGALHGPMRRDVAERVVQGARAGGAQAAIRKLVEAPDQWALIGLDRGSWPPRGITLNEVASAYCDPTERWVFSALIGYGGETEIEGPKTADEVADAALEWLREPGAIVFVFDRHTGALTAHHVPDVEASRREGGVPPTQQLDCLSDQELTAVVLRQADTAGPLIDVLCARIARVARREYPDAVEILIQINAEGLREVEAVCCGEGKNHVIHARGDVQSLEALDRLVQQLVWLTEATLGAAVLVLPDN
jgi:hypothetical protein